MNRAIVVLVFVSMIGCAENYGNINYGDIEKDLVIIKPLDKVVENVKLIKLSHTAFSSRKFNIVAISRSYKTLFEEKALIKKAMDLGASQVIITTKIECAPRNFWGEFQGCWEYDLIYFAE